MVTVNDRIFIFSDFIPLRIEPTPSLFHVHMSLLLPWSSSLEVLQEGHELLHFGCADYNLGVPARVFALLI